MTSDQIETAKADTKKVVADIGNKVAYAKADIKVNAEKAKADVENKVAHAKADAEKARAEIGKKMNDVLKSTMENINSHQYL